VFSTFLWFVSPLWAWFIRAFLLTKLSYFFFALLICILWYIYNVLFLNNLFGYNTLFTYKINNILFITGIYSMCFLGLMKTCKFWMPGCSADGDRLTSPLCTTSGRLRNFGTRFNQIRRGKSSRMRLYRLCCGGWRGEENRRFNFKFGMFCSGSEVSMIHSKVTVNP